MNYLSATKQQLESEKLLLENEYKTLQGKNLKLDMSRGKPSAQQLDLSMPMLDIKDVISDSGVDCRNYGNIDGIPEAKALFGELLNLPAEQIFVGGNASLALMYFCVEAAYRAAFPGQAKPWGKEERPKFICPAPGYDRHFRITQHFGFELITVDMTPQGPDMDAVERLVKDEAVKGIWCVPKYSNPDGITYSDDTVRRLAALKPAATGFKIFWDNAYMLHDVSDTADELLDIYAQCEKNGNIDMPLLFTSTSKVTFSGAGISAMGASPANIKFLNEQMVPMTISYDKLNMLRHVKFLKNKANILAHMKKHKALLKPKFDLVNDIFTKQMLPFGDIAHWHVPNGGYFISLYVQNGCAKRTVELCKQAGVVLTGAGAAYPYGIDPSDSNIRVAPSFPPLEELEQAATLLCICARLACVEKLLTHNAVAAI